MKKIERLKKYAEGGKVRKFDTGGEYNVMQPDSSKYKLKLRYLSMNLGSAEDFDDWFSNDAFGDVNEANELLNREVTLANQNAYDMATYGGPVSKEQYDNTLTNVALANLNELDMEAAGEDVSSLYRDVPGSAQTSTGATVNQLLSGKGQSTKPATLNSQAGKSGSAGANVPWGLVGDAAIAANNAIDNAVVGDKNFSQSSQALDTGVDAAASMASKFGPWGLLAAGILKTANSATKYAGKNVQGFDVNIENSGYGDLGHMESQAGRVWDNGAKTQRLLLKRNELARMALAASDISEDTAYELEARTNSVTNVLQQNQIALAGGIDTSLLGN